MPNPKNRRAQLCPRHPKSSLIARHALACAGIVSLGAAGCGGLANAFDDDDHANVEVTQQAATTLHPLGLLRDNRTTVLAKRAATAAPAGGVPSSLDLSPRFPPPGDQGSMGSCTGWATAYAAKTYQEVTEMNWSRTLTSHQFSPSWVWNQLNGGSDRGISIASALDLIVNSGCDTISSFPYVNGDFRTQPPASSLRTASYFKAKAWSSVATTESDFKNVLLTGNPVIIGFNVYPDWDALNSSTNTVYDSAAGTMRGAHAVAVVGYDDAKAAFKVINSWGTSWGSAGYGWIAYSFLTNASLDLYGLVLNDAPNTASFELAPGDGSWGAWYGPQMCPAGQYASGFKMRIEGSQGSGDDTGLNAVSLECRPPDGSSPSLITPHNGFWGTWSGTAASCPGGGNYARSARIRIEGSQGSGDDTAANNVELMCASGSVINPGGAHTWGAWGAWQSCPAGTRICGVSTRVESPQGSGDDTAMNGMRLNCCRVPSPACTNPVAESWTGALGSTASNWSQLWGDPTVDVANNRLVLTRDDIVDRNTSFSGSYYVSHQITLSGGTVFTPYVYVGNVSLPSLRRSGNDMQFGGDQYGGSWSDSVPAGFAGQRAMGVLTATVTTFVKAQSGQMAMIVIANGSVYRSGWTTAAPPGGSTDWSRFRLVGENNGDVYSGANDHVYVGPLSGCSGLTDADVDSLYNAS